MRGISEFALTIDKRAICLRPFYVCDVWPWYDWYDHRPI